ncbi:MAG TPA: hypothetical protein VFV02_12285 [Acidimicrobiales bacterium]|nr:hypothetical protein [Acidimicrobiales bacterium]
MTALVASSSVVLSNLAYLLGAVVLAVIGGTFVWLRHRQPKSVDANVSAFNRGLRALAPDGEPPEATTAGTDNPVRVEPSPRGLRVIRADEIDISGDHDPVNGGAGAEEAAGEPAGAESG